jgi:hypothetical protein
MSVKQDATAREIRRWAEARDYQKAPKEPVTKKITCQYSVKPNRLRKLLRLIVSLLDFLIRPAIIFPVAAFVAGFCIALLLAAAWREEDLAYTHALEERLQELEKKP